MNSSCLFKLFEYCLLPKLKPFLLPNERQFGYQRGSSCLSACVLLKETILNYSSKMSNVHCAMVDLSKAFDKLNYSILIRKLVQCKLPPLLVFVIKYLCENAYVSVVHGNFKGDCWKIENGVRQGGVLSPHIFNFYINEVFDTISSMNVGCKIGSYVSNIIGYADDIMLISPTKSGLQILIDKLCNILNRLCLPINTGKCEYLIFSNTRNFAFNSTVTVENKVIESSSSCKYLGTILSSNLRIDDDVIRCNYSFLRQFNNIYHKFKFLYLPILISLMKTFCTSFYGSELWLYNENFTNRINKISISYHKAVKAMVHLTPWDNNHAACAIAGLPIFKHFLSYRMFCFVSRILKCECPCFYNLRYYMRNSSFLLKRLDFLFSNKYGIKNVLDNDVLAVRSRIDFIERNEERSDYVPFRP